MATKTKITMIMKIIITTITFMKIISVMLMYRFLGFRASGFRVLVLLGGVDGFQGVGI